MSGLTPEQHQAYLRHLARQDSEKAAVGGGSGGAFDDAGPPSWNRASWEGFKAAYGYYPFGWQNGTRVLPPHFTGAPDWVYELMDMRKPPIEQMQPGG